MYRQLSKVNPKTYLPYVASVVNNLGNLHRNKTEYKQAEQAYKETLLIRQEFAKSLPHIYEIPLADIHLCLGSLYCYNLVHKEKSIENTKKASELYERYPHVPHAVKWKLITQNILDYWENKKPK